MEEEARLILCEAVEQPVVTANLGEAIHRRFAALGGFEFDLPVRESMPDPPLFD